jgi:hypothetical protein
MWFAIDLVDLVGWLRRRRDHDELDTPARYGEPCHRMVAV